jgi:hypothetical protein
LTIDGMGAEGIAPLGTMQVGQMGFHDSSVTTGGALVFAGAMVGAVDIGTGAVQSHGAQDGVVVYIEAAP